MRHARTTSSLVRAKSLTFAAALCKTATLLTVASDDGTRPSEVPPARRVSGPRIPTSEPVELAVQEGGREPVSGWTLNRSEGGLRVVLEGDLVVGDAVVVRVADEPQPRSATVVWVRPSKGGLVAGIAYADSEQGAPPDESTPG